MIGKYKEITVTYTLYDDDIVAVHQLADQNKRTIEQQFELMMTAGCKWDIEKKIKFWQEMIDNKKKNAQVDILKETTKIVLTKENAHKSSTIRNIANPQLGITCFNYNAQPLNDGKACSTRGKGFNSACLFEWEFPNWEVISWKE